MSNTSAQTAPAPAAPAEPANPTAALADELYRAHRHDICRRTDRVFAVIMVVQWVFGVVAALFISPRTWAGTASQVHPHVWAAVFLGATISAPPILLALLR